VKEGTFGRGAPRGNPSTRRLLKKNKGQTSATQTANEGSFVKELDDLFDMAQENALAMITIDEDREFLLAQRERGPRGCMVGWNRQLHEREIGAAEQAATMEMRCQLNLRGLI